MASPRRPLRALPLVAAIALSVALAGCFSIPTWGSPKAELSTPPPTTPPSAPLAVTAIAGPTPASAVVTWQPPAQAGSSPLLGYRLYDTTAGVRALIVELRPQERQVPVPGLAPGLHTFSVTAVSAAGEGPAGAAAPLNIAHPPTAPGAPVGTAVAAGATRGTATVTWAAPDTSGGSPITGYRIRHVDRTSGTLHERAVDASARSLSFADLSTGDHAFSVSAFNAAGEGPAGTSVGLNVPAPPADPPAQGGSGSAPTGGSGGTGGTGGSTGGTSTGGTDGSSTGTSGGTGETGGSGATGGGTGGTGSTGEGSGTTGGGTGTTGGGSGATGGGTGGGSGTTGGGTGATGGGTGTTGGGSGGTGGGSKKAGLNSAPSPPSDSTPPATTSTSSTPLATPPGPPTNLAPLATSQEGEAGFSWDPPDSDGGAPILEYRVYRGVAPDALVLIGSTTQKEAMHTGLSPGATYYFAVSAVNEEGEGDMAGPMPVVAYGAPASPAPELPALVLALAGLAAIAVVLRRR